MRLSLRLPSTSSFTSSNRSASTLSASLRSALRPITRLLDPSSSSSSPSTSASTSPPASVADTGKGVFDIAIDQEDIVSRIQDKEVKPTFHKSSTANFKGSKRKLNDLSRLIAGRGVDEGVLQLKVSPKKQASRLLSMLALARDHAIAKGLNRDKLVIAQAWTSKGPSLRRLDIKGRGRRGIIHHQSSKLHVLLAEGTTAEEKKRERGRNGFRMACRGLSEGDGIGIGRSKPLMNQGGGASGWKW